MPIESNDRATLTVHCPPPHRSMSVLFFLTSGGCRDHEMLHLARVCQYCFPLMSFAHAAANAPGFPCCAMSTRIPPAVAGLNGPAQPFPTWRQVRTLNLCESLQPPRGTCGATSAVAQG